MGQEADDHMYTLVEGTADASKNGSDGASCEELLAGDEEGEGTVASVEDQLRKEMTIYEVGGANIDK